MDWRTLEVFVVLDATYPAEVRTEDIAVVASEDLEGSAAEFVSLESEERMFVAELLQSERFRGIFQKFAQAGFSLARKNLSEEKSQQ